MLGSGFALVRSRCGWIFIAGNESDNGIMVTDNHSVVQLQLAGENEFTCKHNTWGNRWHLHDPHAPHTDTQIVIRYIEFYQSELSRWYSATQDLRATQTRPLLASFQGAVYGRSTNSLLSPSQRWHWLNLRHHLRSHVSSNRWPSRPQGCAPEVSAQYDIISKPRQRMRVSQASVHMFAQ